MTEWPDASQGLVDAPIHRRMTELVSGRAVMAIFRNLGVSRTVALAQRAWDLGIDLVEVPVSEPEAWETLEAVVAEGRARDRVVGAGTVIAPEQVGRCRELGVGFTVAPGLDPSVVEASVHADIPHLPGVSTPSEIQRALRLGCHVMKAFPALVLGTGWFAAMQGPFPGVTLVATGGITAQNAPEFLDAGASMVALGSALADESQLDAVGALVDAGQFRVG